MAGLSPKDPNKYLGPNVYVPVTVARNREPTGADYRQPETGKLYPNGTFWNISKDPTTGIQGDLWYLSKIVANVAYWLPLGGGTVNVETITGDTGGVLGPTGNNFNIIGGTVAAGTNPVRTSGAVSTLTINVQRSQAIASADSTKVGLCNFSSAQFTVDADGFVTLTGGGAAIDSFIPNSGTSPVVPNGSGQVSLLGSGSITTVGSLNTLTVQLTGLTNHAVLVGAGTTTITKVGPTATSGQVLQSTGGTSDPAFSTATYPVTTTKDSILFSSATNVVGEIANGTTGQVLTATTGSAPTWQAAQGGGFIKQVRTSSSAGTALSNNVNLGGTFPNTQGTQVMSVAITPSNAANILVIEGVVVIGMQPNGSPGVQAGIIGIFQDSVTDALYSTGGAIDTQTYSTFNSTLTLSIPFKYYMAAGTTSATTFKIRAGGPSNGASYQAEAFLNTIPTGGGSFPAVLSTLFITEYSA